MAHGGVAVNVRFWHARAGLSACATAIIDRGHVGIILPPVGEEEVAIGLVNGIRAGISRAIAIGSLAVPQGGPRIGS